jgi:hypothetical protein
MEDALRLLITGIVYVGITGLLMGIVLATVNAIVHAWRHERVGWTVLLVVLFLQGFGLATAVYLILHHHEPLPARLAHRSAART